MSAPTVVAPTSNQELQEAVCACSHLAVRGGGSKPGLSPEQPAPVTLDLRLLSGLLEYDPGEFTFTARAGTPLKTVAATLAEHGQYLPFDPPWVDQGATLGGTVAAGLSGAGRYRYGGVRDFLLGVRFVDGQGRLVRGGGKVVKNAAGFDLPKLLVGSLGRLGVLAEVTFKVFPQPEQYTTLRLPQPSLEAALATLATLARSSFDLEALEWVEEEGHPVLYLRQGGLAAPLAERQAALRSWLGGGEPLAAADEVRFWHTARELAWVPEGSLCAKVPLRLEQVAALDALLSAYGAPRRYSAGAAWAWVAWPAAAADLHRALSQLRLGGLLLKGQAPSPLLGIRSAPTLSDRIKGVLDPFNRFPPLG